jgi:copper(I)-binding protein
VNRALRAAVVAVLLVSPVALSACSAGQVTQTESQHRDKTGPMAKVGDITLRAVHLAYPTSGQYQSGDDAELTMAIVNEGSEDDTLVDISGDSFSSFRITGGGTAEGAQSTASAGSSSGSSSAPTSGSSSGSTSGNSTGGAANGLTIPAHSALYLGQEGPTVTLENLSESLTPAQSIQLTMTFEKAGEVTVQAQVATPSRAVERGEGYNFNQESGSEGSNEAAHPAGNG